MIIIKRSDKVPARPECFLKRNKKSVSNGCWVEKIVCIVALVLLGGFGRIALATSGKISTDSEERPTRNYFGTVQTAEGASLKVEYIAIGSRMKTDGIIVYEKPSDSEQNPRDHRIDIDLALVDGITSATHQKPIRYHNVDYYEITIHFKGTSNPQRLYVIESNNHFFCDELDGFHNPVPHEFRFSAVQKIMIEGVRSAGLTKQAPEKQSSPEQQDRKRRYCTEAAKTISELEQEADKLPSSQKGTVTRLVDNIKNWVGGLCSG